MTHLLRPTVYALVLLWANVLYHQAAFAFPTERAGLAYLVRATGLTAMALLFLALVPGLLRAFAPAWPGTPPLIHARRAVGVSTFFFALTHAALAFMISLSASFSSVLFLASRHRIAVLLGLAMLLVLTAMASTSSDKAVRMLGFLRWKRLHRLVYAVAAAAVTHAFLIGSHFTNAGSAASQIVAYGAFFFLVLEGEAHYRRLGATRQERSAVLQRVLTGGIAVLVIAGGVALLRRSHGGPGGPHAQHGAQREQYRADVTTVPALLTPGEPFELRVAFTDVLTGARATEFQVVHDRLLHLIVLNTDLSTYAHLHPEPGADGSFTTTMALPKGGEYRLFFQYALPGVKEGLARATLRTDGAVAVSAALVPDVAPKDVDGMRVSVDPAALTADEEADVALTFAADGAPVADLEPYLGAFGHLVIVSEDLETYAHVHPAELALAPEDRGGPVLVFTAHIAKPGLYRLFAQVQRSGRISLVEFTLPVE